MVELAMCKRARASKHWDNAVCQRLPGLEKECSRPDLCPYYTRAKDED